MKTILIFIFICLFSFADKIAFAQKSNFGDFIKEFKEVSLPLRLNNNYMQIFPYKQWEDNIINSSNERKFICNDISNDYFYRRGGKLESRNNIIVLISKEQRVPKETYDLSQYIIIVYNNEGRRLSQAMICKSSDRYFSNFVIANDSTIFSIQAVASQRTLQPPYVVDVDYLKFIIDANGIIKQSKYKSSMKGELIFRKEIDCFIVEIDGKEQIAGE